MATSAPARKRVPVTAIIIAAVAAAVLIAGAVYLSRPVPKQTSEGPASAEARAYVRNLALSNVTMQATENFMKQQVIEIQGNITNNGPRPMNSIEVNCLFYGVNGQQIYQERVPVLRPKSAPLKPGESRAFRLPFDNLPDGWNQAMPRLVIAGISFAGQ